MSVGVLQYAAVCCSVLQCVAVCCSVLQCVAVCCSVLQCVAIMRRASSHECDMPHSCHTPTHTYIHTYIHTHSLYYIADERKHLWKHLTDLENAVKALDAPSIQYRELSPSEDKVKMCCSMLQYVAACYSMLRRVAVCCQKCCQSTRRPLHSLL